jgi:hypothetical protein
MSLHSRILAGGVFAAIASCQALVPGLSIGGNIRPIPDDMAVLELQEPRRDLPCTVKPMKPSLGFDFVFHTGYQVVMPLREFAGSPGGLTIFFRVTPQEHNNETIYMSQRVEVKLPSLNENSKGDGLVEGTFVLGEGDYHVDWLMRDQQSRICTSYWDLQAKLNDKEAPLKAWVRPTLVEPGEPLLFGEEPPVQRDAEGGQLKVEIIVNFVPRKESRTALDEKDLQGVVGILRRIARDPHIGEFSLVAGSFETQQILYRQENATRIDFPALGDALKSLRLGIVDAKGLGMKNRPSQFVTDLVAEQSKKQMVDALIFIGPKPDVGLEINRDFRGTIGAFDGPMFYFNYNANPIANPWRDLIGNAVKQRKGVEYSITYPKDLFFAWSDLLSRILSRNPAHNGRRSGVTDSCAGAAASCALKIKPKEVN